MQDSSVWIEISLVLGLDGAGVGVGGSWMGTGSGTERGSD
jgi:hypothetical protein